MLASALDLVQTFLTVAAAMLVVWGLIALAISMNDHNGPGVRNAIMTMAGGGLAGAGALLVATIQL